MANPLSKRAQRYSHTLTRFYGLRFEKGFILINVWLCYKGTAKVGISYQTIKKSGDFCFSSISIGLLTYLHIGDIYFCLIFVGIIIICMFDCLRNILAFASTFLVISTSTMLLIQGIVCFVTWDWTYKKTPIIELS